MVFLNALKMCFGTKMSENRTFKATLPEPTSSTQESVTQESATSCKAQGGRWQQRRSDEFPDKDDNDEDDGGGGYGSDGGGKRKKGSSGGRNT